MDNQDRKKLPFRKNCEGYFIDNNLKILAKRTEQNIIIFPGGGIDESETIESGIIRETLEETGAVIQDLKFLKNKKLVWGLNWAKTEKQKQRYKQFQGDDMHFFSGKIKSFTNNSSEEDSWNEEKLMDLDLVIKILDSNKEKEEEILEYRKIQIELLKELKEEETETK